MAKDGDKVWGRGIHLLQTRPAKAKKFPLVPNNGYGKGPHKT